MKLNIKPFFIFGIAVLLASATCNNTESSSDNNTDTTAIAATEPMAVPAAETSQPADSSKQTDVSKDDTVLIKTSMGDIKVRLYKETPLHKANFLKLCSSNFYDNLLFHRVISGFMIQGGDPTSKNAAPGAMLGAGDAGYTVPAEFNSKFRHKRGALAAARQGDEVNPMKASSGCQFYICHADANFLDGNYTVFGEVITGLETVDKIAAAKVDRNDRPNADIKIKSTSVLSKTK
ncbi:MAG TPA: peptidylprolyl isomerase [Bacteroidia bacterium]